MNTKKENTQEDRTYDVQLQMKAQPKREPKHPHYLLDELFLMRAISFNVI